MPGEGAAAMSSRLQSIPNRAAAIVHQLMPKPISSQAPVPETPLTRQKSGSKKHSEPGQQQATLSFDGS
jgi:hypothetical protein